MYIRRDEGDSSPQISWSLNPQPHSEREPLWLQVCLVPIRSCHDADGDRRLAHPWVSGASVST